MYLAHAWPFCIQATRSQVIAFVDGQRHDCNTDGGFVQDIDERLAQLIHAMNC